MLAVVLDYVQKEKKDKKASFVIAPSSLTLNWEKEADKFAKDLKTMVIRGTYEERKSRINQIQDYDLVIYEQFFFYVLHLLA